MTSPRLEWHAQHAGKRKFRSHRRAWLFIARIWIRERRMDELQPYTCHWAPLWTGGKTGVPHIHIGHGRYTPGQRLAHQVKLRIIWPYFRQRAKWRRFRKRHAWPGPPTRRRTPRQSCRAIQRCAAWFRPTSSR